LFPEANNNKSKPDCKRIAKKLKMRPASLMVEKAFSLYQINYTLSLYFFSGLRTTKTIPVGIRPFEKFIETSLMLIILHGGGMIAI